MRLLCACVFVGVLPAIADTYDQRLEFIETTGTQWIDTGIKFNYRRSVMRVIFRMVERPTFRTTICGATDVTDSPTGYSGGKYLATTLNVTKRSNGNYVFLPSFTGSDADGYLWPTSGSYDTDKSYEIESDVATALCNGAKAGFNSKTGIAYNDSGKPDAAMASSFYLGAVNNNGQGLLVTEGSLPKMHWYGAKFWTDGVLVGDFFPALKNGVAGFFDDVTKTFFPSQGQDAFVAPETVTWTGAGAEGDLNDGANWAGGSAPSSRRQVAVIPNATELQVADSDCADFFKAIGGVRLDGSEAVLFFTNVLNGGSFYPPVNGTGVMRLESLQNVYKEFHIYSASPNFRGTFAATNIAVMLRAGYAGGDKAHSTFCWDSSYGNMRLSIQDNARLHANMRIGRTGQFIFTNNGTTSDAEWTFDAFSTYASFHGNGSMTYDFEGNLTYVGSTVRGLSLSSGYYAFHGQSNNFGLMRVRSENSSMVTFGSPMAFADHAKDATIGNMANVFQGCGSAAPYVWNFSCTNAFSANTFALLSYAKVVADKPMGLVNLNGYDQRVGTLGIYAGSFDATKVWNENLVVTSSVPAVLTIYGNCRNDGAAQVFPGRIRGAASVRLNSLEEVMEKAWNWSDATKPGAIRFNCPGSDTTGALIVERGTIEVMETATFSNLTELVATGTGVITIKAAGVGAANAMFKMRVLSDTAQIEVADGLTITAEVFEAPNDTFLKPGRYSGVAAAGVTKSDYLAGAGIVEVTHYGAPWKGWPDVGTAEDVYIAAGTIVSITDADVEKVEALKTISTGSDVEIHCTLTEKTINLTPKFSGGATFYYHGFGETVVLNGDNSGLVAPGGFVFSNVTVVVSNMYGLGGVASAPAYLYPAAPFGTSQNAGVNALYFGGPAITNFAAVVVADGLQMGHDDPLVHFVQMNDLTQTYKTGYPAGHRLRVIHDLEFGPGVTALLGGTTESSEDSLTLAEGATMQTGGQFGSGTIDVHGTITGSLAIEQTMRRITFHKSDCLNLTDNFLYDASAKNFIMDLNGFDQTVPRIKGNNYTNKYQQAYEIYSATPATITVNGKSAAYKNKGDIKMTGAASLCIDSTVTNTTGFGVSTTTGDLWIKSGAFKMEYGAKWTAGRVVLDGGELIVDESAISETFGPRRTTVQLVVNGGTLYLGSSEAIPTVNSVRIGDTCLPRGYYSAATANWIKGPGTLYVRTEGPAGMMFIVR